MRFNLPILFWLTFAISIVAAVAGRLGVNIFVVGLLGVYLFAPLWLTLFSSFAQRVRPDKRLHCVYGIMLVLAGLTILISPLFILSAFAHDGPLPTLIAVAAVFIFIVGQWSAQIDIMRDVHDRQSQARRQKGTRRQSSAAPNRLNRELTSHDLID